MSHILSFSRFPLAITNNPTYAVDLSKSTSVNPQRHRGFIVPKLCKGSQSLPIHGASVTATQTRLQSLYEGMTRQNKVLPNMSGGSCRPRVNPLTSLITSEYFKTQNLQGGYHA